jgi:hypothetical protein
LDVHDSQHRWLQLYTRACSTPHWLVSAHDIKPVALRLLAAERERQEGLSLRLMGLRMSSLEKRHGAKVATGTPRRQPSQTHLSPLPPPSPSSPAPPQIAIIIAITSAIAIITAITFHQLSLHHYCPSQS